MSHTNTQKIQTSISISSLLDIWIGSLTFNTRTISPAQQSSFCCCCTHVQVRGQRLVSLLRWCHFIWERIVSWTWVWQARLGWLGSEPHSSPAPGLGIQASTATPGFLQAHCGFKSGPGPSVAITSLSYPSCTYHLLILEVLYTCLRVGGSQCLLSSSTTLHHSF